MIEQGAIEIEADTAHSCHGDSLGALPLLTSLRGRRRAPRADEATRDLVALPCRLWCAASGAGAKSTLPNVGRT